MAGSSGDQVLRGYATQRAWTWTLLEFTLGSESGGNATCCPILHLCSFYVHSVRGNKENNLRSTVHHGRASSIPRFKRLEAPKLQNRPPGSRKGITCIRVTTWRLGCNHSSPLLSGCFHFIHLLNLMCQQPNISRYFEIIPFLYFTAQSWNHLE